MLRRERRERGDIACSNTTGVPASDLHAAVIETLRKTFTPETFVAHMEQQAGNIVAREQRAAERSNLLAELPASRPPSSVSSRGSARSRTTPWSPG